MVVCQDLEDGNEELKTKLAAFERNILQLINTQAEIGAARRPSLVVTPGVFEMYHRIIIITFVVIIIIIVTNIIMMGGRRHDLQDLGCHASLCDPPRDPAVFLCSPSAAGGFGWGRGCGGDDRGAAEDAGREGGGAQAHRTRQAAGDPTARWGRGPGRFCTIRTIRAVMPPNGQGWAKELFRRSTSFGLAGVNDDSQSGPFERVLVLRAEASSWSGWQWSRRWTWSCGARWRCCTPRTTGYERRSKSE
jgi:hypothetical protein